ncbi:hypothetical protein AURDEDRAFT_172230 [Auricularia subglabra TFB-10046 SS5]|nr:hypothetical protein AURDEDRAFT_172230 [Auricularia subglabra TFB-10046 SS5]
MADIDIFECSANDLVRKDFILTFCFVLPSRLDPDALRAALYSTIEQKMKKAGARLARRRKRLEFHVPRTFSPNEPPCGFSTRESDKTLQDLPFPPQPVDHDASQPCYMPGLMSDVAAYFRGANCPRSLADALRPGVPMVHAHATTLKDATLVGLTVPHIMFDVHGAKLFLEAWTSALREGLASVSAAPMNFPPLSRKAIEEHIFNKERTHLPKDEPIRGFFVLGLLATVQFVLSLIWRLLWDPDETEILIRVPKAWLQQQKEMAMAELDLRGRGEWVSTSDVLLAWIFRTVHAHRRDGTPVALHSAVNLRKLLPALFNAPYINNAVHAVVVRPPLPALQLATQPVLDTALAIRRALNELKADEPRLLTELADQAQHPDRQLYPARPGEQWAISTNWLSAKFLELDFGGGGAPVRPVWFTAFRQDNVSLPLRGTGAIHCEDAEAVWATWALGAEDLRALRRSNHVQYREYPRMQSA